MNKIKISKNDYLNRVAGNWIAEIVQISMLIVAFRACMHLRVANSYVYMALIPFGSVVFCFQVILYLDNVFSMSKGRYVSVIASAKRIVLLLSTLFIFFGLALFINDLRPGRVMVSKAVIEEVRGISAGSFYYKLATAKGWRGGSLTFPLYRNESGYKGRGVDIMTAKGALGIERILEVRLDREKFFLTMLENVPGSTNAMSGLVGTYVEMNKFDKAMQWYEKYLQAKAGRDEVGKHLGARLIQNNQFGNAVKVFQAMLPYNMDDFETHYLLGYALSFSGRKKEAQDHLKRAIEIDPLDYRGYYSLGYVYRDTRQIDKAIETWEKLLEIRPNFPEVQNLLAEIRD